MSNGVNSNVFVSYLGRESVIMLVKVMNRRSFLTVMGLGLTLDISGYIVSNDNFATIFFENEFCALIS